MNFGDVVQWGVWVFLLAVKDIYILISLTIVALVAIIAIMICCLAALGYNSKMSIEKEKIEVESKSNFNQTK